MWWCLGALGAAIVGLVALVKWAERIAARPDRPGERTCATFRAEHPPPRKPHDPPGEALAQSLSDAIGGEGEVGASDGYGWVLAVRDAYVEVIPSEAEENAWALFVRARSIGGPGPIHIAQAIDRALRHIDGVTQVRWHARETFDPFTTDRGHDHPVDGPTPTYRS